MMNNSCDESGYACIYHPECNSNYPICYPKSMNNRRICPIISRTTTTSSTTTTTTIWQRITPNISANSRWEQNGTTVAGGNGLGSGINQLSYPYGLFVDDNHIMLIADCHNHRIVQWKTGDINGNVVAGGNGPGNGLDQLHGPTNVLLESETNSLIICDSTNRRVVRWSRMNGTKQGEILLDNILCWGLAIDDQRYVYVSNYEKHEVRRYATGDKNGTLVAGGFYTGSNLNQLIYPTYIFVDRKQTIYVSGYGNYRVMKRHRGATEGVVVATSQSIDSSPTQRWYPQGIFVDMEDALYVVDQVNHQVIRWSQEKNKSIVIVGGRGAGASSNQFYNPTSLCFDQQGNLFVTDQQNHRVQRFLII